MSLESKEDNKQTDEKDTSSDKKSEKETHLGVDQNVLAALCYLPISGMSLIIPIICLFAEKKNKFVKFHALQSIALSVTFMLLGSVVFIAVFIPICGILSFILVMVGAIVLDVYLMYQAFQGVMFKVPVIGDEVVKRL